MQTTQCEWCYSPATQETWSIRNHCWIALCDRHYDEINREIIARILDGAK